MYKKLYMKYMEEYNKEEYIKKRKWSQKEFDDYMQIIENYIKYNDINVQKLRELKKFFNLDTNFWCFIQWVNCYAYALGIDLPYECFNINWYRPGCFYEVIKRTKLEKNQDNYIERLELDFKTLEFEYRIVFPEERISCNEWKIAFFNDVVCPTNFHFLRQGKDGLCYHKQGYKITSIPTNKDDHGNIITNPLEAYFEPNERKDSMMYQYNRCYSLRLK